MSEPKKQSGLAVRPDDSRAADRRRALILQFPAKPAKILGNRKGLPNGQIDQ